VEPQKSGMRKTIKEKRNAFAKLMARKWKKAMQK
jgi:hypothetical protein